MATRTTEIEITSESNRSGLRGRMERKRAEYVDLARAYGLVLTDMDLDDRQNAIEAAPKKFLQAMNTRNGDAGRPAHRRKGKGAWKKKSERVEEFRAYLAEHPGATVDEIAAGLQVNKSTANKYGNMVGKYKKEKSETGRTLWRYYLKPSHHAKNEKRKPSTTRASAAAPVAKKRSKKKSPIHGKTLTLFLLEHMNGEPRTSKWFTEELAKAGSPLKAPQAINGPLNAALVKQGWAKKDGDGYQRTSKGAEVAVDLRKLLEASGAVVKGGYLQEANA